MVFGATLETPFLAAEGVALRSGPRFCLAVGSTFLTVGASSDLGEHRWPGSAPAGAPHWGQVGVSMRSGGRVIIRYGGLPVRLLSSAGSKESWLLPQVGGAGFDPRTARCK